ncbi:DUF6503 family protein [Aquimarina sp. W85]|uniref:DUF6503 family protein n=1 Tax=Aquimarina rhodophyticola TaxID=3342246 RepID=UPI003671A3BC
MRLLLFCTYFIILVGMLSPVHSQTAATIVDQVIEKAGGSSYDQAVIHFTFRGQKFRSQRNFGMYTLERTIVKESDQINDIVSNYGLERLINGCVIPVEDSLVTKISDNVNAVHYFALLPFGLNAPAVNKKFIGETIIDNKVYYKIEVTFNKDGGGTDYEDEFMYWIDKDTYNVDYFAYRYAVNGGGIRFRKAINPRVINGLRFVDYINYKTDVLETSLEKLTELYTLNKLTKVSEIILEDINVHIAAYQ